MKWCPTCNIDFEDYVEKCTDCGALLMTEAAYNQHTKPNKHAYNPEDLNLKLAGTGTKTEVQRDDI